MSLTANDKIAPDKITPDKPINPIGRIAALPLLALIKLYQWFLSPFMGNACRFTPSCSHYGYEAIQAHGPLLGAWLTIKRLARCNPWGGSGHDPVPPRSYH